MRRAAFVLSLTITLAAAPAAAECAMASAFVAPSNDLVLPPNPTLYVFSIDSQWVDDTVRSATPMQLGPRETFGGTSVRRVRFAIRRGPLRVRVGERRFEYRVDPDWRRGEAGPTLGERRDVSNRWACSYTDTVHIPVESSALAFEVSWPGGRTIVPAHVERFWGEHVQPAAIELGHVSCLGLTTPGPGRPDADVFEITALYPDGSRARVRGARRVAEPEVDLALPEYSASDGATTIMTTPPARWPLPLGFAVASVVTLMLVLRARSSRRRAS